MRCRKPLVVALLLFASLFVLPLSAQEGRILPNCPMNIIIAVDFSASEMAYLDEIHTVLLALTDPFELDDGKLKIGIITFNRGAQLALPLTGDTRKLDEAIEELRTVRMVYATDIHAAIELANREFAQHSIVGVPSYFVLISDGDPHAHARGHGWQADLVNVNRLKAGDPTVQAEPVHVFTLYTGSLSANESRYGATVLKDAIHHMKRMASDEQSFFYFEEYPRLVKLFLHVSSCL